MSVQYIAEASQKLTAPELTAKRFAVTVAVSVTALPETAVVTGLPPEVASSVISVGTDCDQASIVSPQEAIKRAARIRTRQRTLGCRINLKLPHPSGMVVRPFIPDAIPISAIRPASEKLVRRNLKIPA
jgi:hypothetical protein